MQYLVYFRWGGGVLSPLRIDLPPLRIGFPNHSYEVVPPLPPFAFWHQIILFVPS